MRRIMFLSALFVLSIVLVLTGDVNAISSVEVKDITSLNISLSRTEGKTSDKIQMNEVEFVLDDSSVVFLKAGEHDFINITDSYYAYSPGMPNLPRKTFEVRIPKDMDLVGVSIVEGNYVEIDNMNIMPVPQVNLSEIFIELSEEEIEGIYREEGYPGEVKPNEIIYSSDELFPYEFIYYDTYFEDDERIVRIRIPPALYNPVEKRVFLIKNLKLNIALANASDISYIQQTTAESTVSSISSINSISSIASLSSTISSIASIEPDVEWEKTFGGTGGDSGYSVQQTSDSGYIITGYTNSFGAGYDDVYLIKTDSNGNLQWQKTFGGTSSEDGYSVQQTTDGGYIIAGSTASFEEDNYDIYLIKTDVNGNLQWQKTFGGTGSDYGYSVDQTSDGGYIIGGYTNGNVYLIKTDFNGNLQWQKTFGGAYYNDYGYSVQQTTDGGYIIGGETASFGAGYWDVYLIKTDSNGNLQWQKTFGGTSYEGGYSVQQTSDGGYIIVGSTSSFGAGSYDVYLIKTDPNGNLQWQKTFGGTSGDFGHSVQQTLDNGYIVVGHTNWDDVYLIKTDSNGNSQWQKTFGGTGSDSGHSVQQTSDGGYILLGFTTSFGAGYTDVYLIKLGPTCSDGVKNQDETDVDCGGVCGLCSLGKSCSGNSDCQTNYCDINNICSIDTCADGIQNGLEEGVDCGWVCGNSCGKCVSVVNNGDSNQKIDVVFVGSGFPDLTAFSNAVSDSIDYDSDGYGLMYYEPFSLNKDRFNFWRVNELETFSGFLRSYESESERLAKKYCPQMDQLILLSIEPRFRSHAYALVGYGMKKAFVTMGCEYLGACPWPLDIDGDYYSSLNSILAERDVIRTVVHEFGHSFGGLDDEHDYNIPLPSLFSGPNCDDSACNKWSDIIGAQCIQGCGYSNWYRAYDNTLMRNHFSSLSKFEAVNERELLSDIMQSSTASSALLETFSIGGYDLSYALELGYNSGNVSVVDLELVSGEPSLEYVGENYTLNVTSFNDSNLFSTSFDFALQAMYTPPANWFDESGNQIFTPNESGILILNETNQSFVVPYFNNAKSINIYDIGGILLASVNISQYHDLDEDNIVGVADNCPFVYNPSQDDADGDGIGNLCDLDFVPDDAFKFFINDFVGVFAWFGDEGNIALAGSLVVQDCVADAGNLFEVRDSLNEVVASVNGTGDLCVESFAGEMQVGCDSGNTGIMFQNSLGTEVSSISDSGALCLMGKVYESAL